MTGNLNNFSPVLLSFPIKYNFRIKISLLQQKVLPLQMNLSQKSSSFEDFAGQVVIYTEIGNARCAKGRDLLRREGVPYTDVSLDSFPQHTQEVFDRTGTEVLPQIFFNNIYIGNEADLERVIGEKNKWESLIEHVRREKCTNGPIVPHPMNAIGFEEYDNENNNKCCEEVLWVPDEYSKLVRDMKNAQLIKNNRVSDLERGKGNFVSKTVKLKVYRSSFKGEQLIEWLMRQKGIRRSEALEVGQELIDRHVGRQTSKEAGMTFSPDRYYQLVEDDENKPLNAVQNGEDEEEKKPRIPVAKCNEKFTRLLKPVYSDILTDHNQSIIYGGLSSNDNFTRYIQFARELNQVTFDDSTPDDRLTFFINVYNMMLIHITLKHGPPIGIWQRRKLVNATYYLIGGHRYALHSIINGILRANKKGPGMLWKAFGKQDERLPISLSVCDPLIYFALCSGSKTTPPLRVYHSNTIHQEMRENARTALLKGDKFLRVDMKKNVIHLGKTFKWFSDDFGGTIEKTLQWILDVIDTDVSDKKNNLQKLFFTGEYSVEYIPYDWSTNGRMDEKEKEEMTKNE
ncbi:Protein CBG01762 [Caenorhabditis briggsae]|uniref:Protein CBG01762 n=2 Tax=Caenorhabditis briggsae TaxID=6238 RepID=A8WQW7_CAEBR|nr:Protein CBG01762 [Caenorhabditis briggsae]CAP22875.2 Protein CBG01762 [Caenorhabditis briggsae]